MGLTPWNWECKQRTFFSQAQVQARQQLHGKELGPGDVLALVHGRQVGHQLLGGCGARVAGLVCDAAVLLPLL